LAYEQRRIAFFNQQLAAMLRDGIPLEGALRRLCQEMKAGSLRTNCKRSKPTSPRRADGRRARAAPVAEFISA